jgi:hypothetical protein
MLQARVPGGGCNGRLLFCNVQLESIILVGLRLVFNITVLSGKTTMMKIQMSLRTGVAGVVFDAPWVQSHARRQKIATVVEDALWVERP